MNYLKIGAMLRGCGFLVEPPKCKEMEGARGGIIIDYFHSAEFDIFDAIMHSMGLRDNLEKQILNMIVAYNFALIIVAGLKDKQYQDLPVGKIIALGDIRDRNGNLLELKLLKSQNMLGGMFLTPKESSDKIWLIKSMSELQYSNLMRKVIVIVENGIDLSHRDLSGLNLEGFNLSKANMTGCCLYKTYLTNTILYEACLKEAICYYTDFVGARITNVDMSDIKIINSDLTDAVFNNGNMHNARIEGSTIERTSFINTNLKAVLPELSNYKVSRSIITQLKQLLPENTIDQISKMNIEITEGVKLIFEIGEMNNWYCYYYKSIKRLVEENGNMITHTLSPITRLPIFTINNSADPVFEAGALLSPELFLKWQLNV